MDILKMGAEILTKQLSGDGQAVETSAVQDALSSVLGDSDGGIDFGSLVSGLQSGGMAEMASSWLGDGENAPISTGQLQELLGSEKIDQLASSLNCDEGSLMSGLKQTIPEIVDKASSGGSLLDSVGGLGGVASLAKGFFK